MVTSVHPLLPHSNNQRSYSSFSSIHNHNHQPSIGGEASSTQNALLIPDLEIQEVGRPSTVIDVTIVDPAAPSYVYNHRSSTKAKAAANRAALQKHQKYDHVAAEHRPPMQLVPIAMECFGAANDETLQFYRRMAKAAEDNGIGFARGFEMHARMSMSVALQVANSRLVSQNINHLQ